MRLPRSEPDAARRRGVDPVSERVVGERDRRLPSVPPSGEAEDAVIWNESSEIKVLPWIMNSDAAAIGAMADAAAGYSLLIPTLPLP